MKRTRILISILILAVSLFSIGYLVYPSMPVARTSVTTATSVSTSSHTYQVASMVYALTTNTLHSTECYYDYYGNYVCYTNYYNIITTTHSAFALVSIQATTTQVFTNTAYDTSSWIESVPPYSYLLSAQNLPTVITILAVSSVLAIAALAVAIKKERNETEPYREVELPRQQQTINQTLDTPKTSLQTKRAATKYCRECGAKIPRDSKFCEECGMNIA
jgi:ribosomal protein L40E